MRGDAWRPFSKNHFREGLADYFAHTGLLKALRMDIDASGQEFIVEGEGSFEVLQFEGNATKPVCHFLRGFLCGIGGELLGIETVSCEEMACQAIGSKVCRFRVYARGA